MVYGDTDVDGCLWRLKYKRIFVDCLKGIKYLLLTNGCLGIFDVHVDDFYGHKILKLFLFAVIIWWIPGMEIKNTILVIK